MKKIFVLLCILSNFHSIFYSQDQKGFYTLDQALKIHPDSVFKLSLKKMKLNAIPGEITNFKNLTHLDISSNKISILPDFMKELKNLQELDISRNKFSIFPNQICSLNQLEVLKMNRNNMDTIDECIISLSKLNYIDFWDNPIKEFPLAFLGLKNLKEIHAEGIRYNAKFQEKWSNLLPQIKLFFDAPCDCVD